MPRFKLDPTSPSGIAVAPEPVQISRQSNGYVSKIQYLNEIQDVEINSTPEDDQSLAYDTASGKWIPQTISGGGGGGATNLAATLSATNTIVTSDTGTDATIPSVDGTNAGVMTPTQKTKLDGITSGATANSTDANLLARVNHTGTQVAATISDFSAAADARISNAAGTSIASLSGGKVPTSQLPAISLTTVQTAASQVAQLALTAEAGDVVVRTDENKSYMHNGGTAGTMADYTLLNTPADAVTSVNGQTGVVSLAKGDVGLGNVDNTSDVNKPVSTAHQAALDLKAPLASPTFTGTVVLPSGQALIAPALGTPASGVMTNVTGTASGLTAGNVTTNANLTGHVTSTGNATVLGSFTHTQLNTAVSDADLARTSGANTFTGVQTMTSPAITTPTGIVKGDVGLGNVDNTSDATKKSDILATIYPVGSIYISTLSTNPNTLLGFGTWATFGAGRVMVGRDSSDTDFDTAEETGGAKTHTLTTAQMPAHTHGQNILHNGVAGSTTGRADFVTDSVNKTIFAQSINTITEGGGGSHPIVQPYIVVYMWKRTV